MINELLEFVDPELVILIPVLMFVGYVIKRSEKKVNIPFWLIVFGITLATLWVLATSVIGGWQDGLMAVFVAICQGVLTGGAAVGLHQAYKQKDKKNE